MYYIHPLSGDVIVQGSSQIALGSLVADRPYCQLVPHSLNILDVAVPLYERASQSVALPTTRVRSCLLSLSHISNCKILGHPPKYV
jgi:hypothetical protein